MLTTCNEGPLAIAVAIAPLIQSIAAKQEREIKQNMQEVIGAREKISQQVTDLLASINTEGEAKQNLASAQKQALAILDTVRNPGALALAPAQGMALQKQFSALETRFGSSSMASLVPFRSDEKLVAGTLFHFYSTAVQAYVGML